MKLIYEHEGHTVTVERHCEETIGNTRNLVIELLRGIGYGDRTIDEYIGEYGLE